MREYTVQYLNAKGKAFEWDGGFLVDKENKLHHTHIFENGSYKI